MNKLQSYLRKDRLSVEINLIGKKSQPKMVLTKICLGWELR